MVAVGLFVRRLGAGWEPARIINSDFTGLRADWPPHSVRHGNLVYRLADLSPLLLSIALLAVLLGTVYLYADASLPVGGGLFTVSDFIVPLAFFLIQLTSRRHGPARALTQLVAALVLCTLVVIADPPALRDLVLTLPVVTARMASLFAIAFLFANGAGIAFFESARGPLWWRAPATSALAAGLIFCTVYYPLAAADGARSAALHFVQMGAESGLLLIPYWLLRAAIKPLPGLNGY